MPSAGDDAARAPADDAAPVPTPIPAATSPTSASTPHPTSPPPQPVFATNHGSLAAPAMPPSPAAPPRQKELSNGDEREPRLDAGSPRTPAAASSTPRAAPVAFPAGSLAPSPSLSSPASQYSSRPPTSAASPASDAYRVSPVGAPSSVVSLPSMRTIEPLSQQQSPGPLPGPTSSHHGVSTTISPPAMASNPAPSYSHHHATALPAAYPHAHDAANRYPLPHDARMLGSRGSKKEIKRRTKTGCRTCRNRRIKCDEVHPNCNNCRKSKRECLGYDPIFRQQAAGSPIGSPAGSQSASHLQPTSPRQAPLSSPPSASSALHSTPALGPRPNKPLAGPSSSMPAATHPSSPATSLASTLANQPTTPAGPAASLACLAAVSSPRPEPGHRDPASAARPAAHPIPIATLPPSPKLFDHSKHSLAPALDPSSSHRASGKMSISEIIDSLGPPPPPLPPPPLSSPAAATTATDKPASINTLSAPQMALADETLKEITKVYHEMYAAGLSVFFESTWFYFTHGGKMIFPDDANLRQHMASFLKILEAVKANDHAQMAYSGALETRIVWELASTAYQTPDRTNNAMRMALPPEDDATEVRNRLRVVEALLCGDYLDGNPLAPPVAAQDQHRTRQFDFWYSLAEFVRRRDDGDATTATNAREDALGRMRRLLDGRENRDVLYSIAVVRELAPKYETAYDRNLSHQLDESDPKNRLAVARKFILDEAQVTGGTTNVVRRFSDIASRAFVNPGVNVAREA